MADNNVILKRAQSYCKMSRSQLGSLIRMAMDNYNMLMMEIREMCGSDARNTTIQALTKPEQILILLALTEAEYEALSALPHDQLPLLINKSWLYPDQETLYKERLKNG